MARLAIATTTCLGHGKHVLPQQLPRLDSPWAYPAYHLALLFPSHWSCPLTLSWIGLAFALPRLGHHRLATTNLALLPGGTATTPCEHGRGLGIPSARLWKPPNTLPQSRPDHRVHAHGLAKSTQSSRPCPLTRRRAGRLGVPTPCRASRRGRLPTTMFALQCVGTPRRTAWQPCLYHGSPRCADPSPP